jgi:arabinofuranosyltransferase
MDGWRPARGLMFVGVVVIILRTAWVSDDAYITFRTVENIVDGFGPRWNVTERVQAYTHPLWLGFLLAGRLLHAELYFIAIGLGVAMSAGALALIAFRVAAAPWQAVAALAVLGSSRAFVDYATSGLENALSYLLVTLVIASAISPPAATAPRRAMPLVLASLVLVNRLDLLWLIGPIVCWQVWARRPVKLLTLLVGVTPLAVWEVFSLVYYGFLVPNTAYAKTHVGIERGELVWQGIRYLQESWVHDPITLGVMGLSVLVALLRPHGQWRAVVAGQLGYMAYVVWIGGDFMSGRHLSVPLVAAVAHLAAAPVAFSAPARMLVVIAPVTAGLMAVSPNLTSGPRFGQRAAYVEFYGITDERQFYYPRTGLLRINRAWQPPALAERETVRQMVAAGQTVATRDAVGMFGYAAGASLHIVDWYALTDPLLARLPSTRPWRVGHFRRGLPDGYIESLRSGDIRIRDPRLAEYYRALVVITRGPLFTRERWIAIARMQLGHDDRLLE